MLFQKWSRAGSQDGRARNNDASNAHPGRDLPTGNLDDIHIMEARNMKCQANEEPAFNVGFGSFPGPGLPAVCVRSSRQGVVGLAAAGTVAGLAGAESGGAGPARAGLPAWPG